MTTGRAARVRLQRRLAVARHGAELLDRKRRILAEEVERLELVAERTELAWLSAERVARTWGDRAMALDGPVGVRAAAPVPPAQVEVDVAAAMGVAYPVDTRCESPPPRATGGSSAVAIAAGAYADALDAAVAHAAALRAVAAVRAELVATRTRQRAVERHWVPRLEGELADIERALEELEMAEGLRLRWAMGATAGASAGASSGAPPGRPSGSPVRAAEGAPAGAPPNRRGEAR
ncbi:V-type ATP synthase subunit D [Actinotalea sp. M2MS4P-6]|uniref:V-type ATP synthase subunit D n=1 Tax=Actinotalea sp. M2MS4P-6 TaxID=2983762 RepID=UPI0021E43839|nr:V-type ATP synthase subunit D [Actinotalea sp. M2MS4P-6]MCV2393571.1 V-type ATP synthase subunit D [Actinotalea sp. M2MS4P-6]